MAKTTSQIVAENKKKRAEEEKIESSRNAIHNKQMAGIAPYAAAKTKATLSKAGLGSIAPSVDSYYRPVKSGSSKSGSSDIAPLSSRITGRMTVGSGNSVLGSLNKPGAFSAPLSYEVAKMINVGSQDDEKKWYQSGHFKDGWDFGDITKTILGLTDDTATLKDLTLGSFKRGYYNSLYGEESYKAMHGRTNYRDVYQQILQGDEYQFTPGSDLAGGLSGAMELAGQMARQFTHPRTVGAVGGAGIGAALLGNAGPQVLLPDEVITVPAAAAAAFKAASAVSNMEIEAGHAYNEMIEAGISEDIAKVVADSVGLGNAGLELVQLDELMKAYKVTSSNPATKSFAKKFATELGKRGVDVFKETTQEVAQEGVTITGVQAASLMDKGELAYSGEEVKGRLKDTAKSSALSFGMMNLPAAAKNTATMAVDHHNATALSKNEKTVFNKLVADEIANRKKDGKTVSHKDIERIEASVRRDMESGAISVETIEEILGGKEYDQYKSSRDDKVYNEILEEHKKLKAIENPTAEQIMRMEELDPQVKTIQEQQKNTAEALRSKVYDSVKNERLAESYRERARKGDYFQADLTKYTEKQQKIVQKAIDSKVLNNTNRSHQLVDLVAKIGADKDIDFDFANNEKIKESGFAVEGVRVNGYINENGITVNVESSKALNTVVGHEITHVLEDTELYKDLQKAVFDYAESKGELTSRWKDLKKIYKDADSYTINKELTADLVGDYLFTDADFVNQLYTCNRSTFEKLYDEIKYLCRVVTAGSKEARQLEKVKKAFADAYLTNTVETARETSHENRQPKSADVLEQNAAQSLDNDTVVKEKLKEVDLEVDDQSGTVSFSLSSLEDSFNVSNSDYLLNNTEDTGFVQARKEYVDALAKSIAVDKGKPTEEEVQKAERYMDSLFLIHDLILDDRDRLDYEAAVDKSAWVSNAEYGGSIDFSTLCAKRRLFTGTFDAIQNALPDTVLDENDFLQIRNMLLESDQESPCSMCYVEGSRAKHGVYVQKWLKEYLKTNSEWRPQIADFTSTTRLEQTRIQHPEAYAAYQAAMNKLSQRKPKEASVRTDYKGEILRDFDDATNVEEKNKNGGVRFNSFSDFEVIHALDCMQVLTDMSRVGLNGQAYTKVKEFAECFGNTGLKINLSLVAKDVDANGKLVFDETNGMKYNEAMDLRDRYSDNVGSVIVVFNEAQLKAALADPEIDYVLPFHRSQWKKSQYTMMGLPAQTKDFTNFQNDRIKNPKTGRDVKLAKIKHTSTFTNEQTGETFEIKDNIMPNQYWDFDKSGRENAETYLKYINDNGMTPKFSFLLSKDASGKWVLPDDAVGDGYFKLLIDFKMYNNDGWGSPQNPVVPDFNMGYIQQMLENYKGGHSAFPVANDVVDKFVESKKEKHSLSEGGGNVDSIGGEQAHPAAATKYSLSDDIAPTKDYGNLNIKSEDVMYQPRSVEEILAEPKTAKQTAQTPTEKANKHYRDTVLSLDKMPEEFRKKYGDKWETIQRATDRAHDLVVRGVEGVNPLWETFDKLIQEGLVDEFDRYMYHWLNVDRMSLDRRFGLKNKPVFGEEITAEMSRQEIKKIEKSHPEFMELTGNIYAYNDYLRGILVESGAITQETANLWAERYPHYVPIRRAGFNDVSITDLLSFVVDNMDDVPVSDSMDTFFNQIDNAAPLKKATGGSQDINPLMETMTERAFQTYWTLAMRAPDSKSIAPLPKSPAKTVLNESNAPAEVTVTTETTPKDAPRSSLLDVDEVLKKGKRNPWNMFQEYFLDNGMVFERLSKKTGDRGLEADWNFIRNARGIAQNLIGNGDPDKGVKALKGIFEAVEKTGAQESFYQYLGHRRHLDGMTLRLRYGVASNKSFMGKDVSASDSSKEIYRLEQAHPEFKQLAEDIYAYNNYQIDVMVEHGLLTQEDADLWKELYPHYVPTKQSKGKLEPMFQSMARNTLNVQRMVAMNDFGIHLKNTLNTVTSEALFDMDSFIDKMDNGANMFEFGRDGENYTFTVYENSNAVTFKISDEMYEALKPVNDLLAAEIPLLSQASTLRRKLITAYSPWFTMKNFVRDVQEIVINSQHPMQTYATIPKAIGQMLQKGEYYQEYVRNGGEQNTYFDTETGSFDTSKSVSGFAENKTPLKLILDANNFVEMIPRLSEYIASREAGVSVQESMLDAARVTVNFGAGGKATKFLNRNGATFLNASVQGAVQQVRNVQEAFSNGFKGWAGLAARYAVAGIPAVLLNHMIWDDDEDYQNLPDYITENYYIVWKYGDGKFVRIPKGRTAAVLQNAVEQVVKASSGNDEADWKGFMRLVSENIAPNNPLEDNIFAPIVQVATNKTWYEDDLVPSRLKKLPVTEQYDEKTDIASIKLSQAIEDSPIGKYVDLSPKQINYLLDQYSGVIGDTLLPFGTPKAESPSDSLIGKLGAPLRDIFTTDSVLNHRVTGDFYETLEAAEAKAEKGTVEDKLRSQHLITANIEISKLLEKQREIQIMNLPDSDKYKLSKDLKNAINHKMEEALQTSEDIKVDGIYGEAGDKRYNFDNGRWYEIKPSTSKGHVNWYYQQEQNVTKAFDVTPNEYWNNKEAYDDMFYLANGYDRSGVDGDSYMTTYKAIGYENMVKIASDLTEIKADRDANGNAISGSRKRKLKSFLETLDLTDMQKKLLYKTQYGYDKRNDREICKYLNSKLNLTGEDRKAIATELGLKIDSDGYLKG